MMSDANNYVKDPAEYLAPPGASTVVFFGIGGGSDVDTALLLADRYKKANPDAVTIVFVALGAKTKGDGASTIIDVDLTIRRQQEKGFQLLRGQGGSDCEELPLLWRAEDGSGALGLIAEPAPEWLERASEIFAKCIISAVETQFSVTLSRTPATEEEAGQLRSALPRISIRVNAVDTGGDVLALIFEKEAKADLGLPAGDSMVLRPVDEIAGGESELDKSEPPVLVRAGQHYVPFGQGLGDLSYHQFGPDNSKRDEYSLRIIERARELIQQWTPLESFSVMLCVVGFGADGETSVEGVLEANRTLPKYGGVCADLEDLLTGQTRSGGPRTSLDAAFAGVPRWKNPVANKTPWIIRKAIVAAAERRRRTAAETDGTISNALTGTDPPAGGAVGENPEVPASGAPSSRAIVTAARGAKMLRRLGETEPKFFECRMDEQSLREVWFFTYTSAEGLASIKLQEWPAPAHPAQAEEI